MSENNEYTCNYFERLVETLTKSEKYSLAKRVLEKSVEFIHQTFGEDNIACNKLIENRLAALNFMMGNC